MTLTERICVVCGVMPYLTANVCSVCRDRIPYLLGSIHRRWQRYIADGGEPTVQVTTTAELVDEYRNVVAEDTDVDGKPTGQLIVIGRVPTGRQLLTGRRLHTHTPLAGPVRSAITGSRVSGTAERPLPVDVDAVDLTSRANIGSIGLRTRGDWSHTDTGDPDQVGELPAATLLDWWAHEFVGARELAEHLPDATVPALVKWLAVPTRIQWACDHHPEVRLFADDLASINSRLGSLAGDRNPRPQVLPTPCPDCDLQTLVRRPEDSWIQCSDEGCARVLSPQEYQQHARDLVAARRHAE